MGRNFFIKTTFVSMGLLLSMAGYAEPQVSHPSFTPYNYTYPALYYGQPYYPRNRQTFNNRNSHRFNGRNDWFGDSRMRNWNRAMTNVISDMLGEGAGDFEFDMKIKFKAKGKGKGRGKGRANARTNQRYENYYRGNYLGRGNYYGGGNSYQNSGYRRRFGYTPYAPPYSVYPVPSTYTSYPPLPATKSPSVSKSIKAE